MLKIGRDEFEVLVKYYQRLQNNLTIFVDRSNYELAAIAQVIEQKRQNLVTLEQMAQGREVTEAEPVAKVGGTFTAPPEIAQPVGAAPTNGAKVTP